MRRARQFRNEIVPQTIFACETLRFEAARSTAFRSDFSLFPAHIRAVLSDEKIFSSFPQRPLQQRSRR